MKLFGYKLQRLVADNPEEPFWVNTIKGNKHYRLFSLEYAVSPDGLSVLVLYVGKYLFSIGKVEGA